MRPTAAASICPRTAAFVSGGGAQFIEVLGESADGRGVGASVVVDDDDELAWWCRLVGRDGVEGLPGHTAGQCTVTDDGDDMTVAFTFELMSLRDSVGPGQ